MKRLLPIAILSIMLTGCVKQSDYDELQEKYDKLQSKYDDLEDENEKLSKELNEFKNPMPYEIQDFTVDEFEKTYINPETDEEITLKLIQEDIPILDATYTISGTTDNISVYEHKITWFVTEMVDYSREKGFPLFSIDAYTKSEPSRSLSSSILDGEIKYWGDDTKNHYVSDPDWFIDTCADIVSNGYEDKWLIKTIEKMKEEMDSSIDFH